MNKQTIQNRYFAGERPLYRARDLVIRNCFFDEGESPLKEGRSLNLDQVEFRWKYPLWRCSDVQITRSVWQQMGRSGVWYTNHIQVSDCLIEAPKNFRRCQDLTIQNTDLLNAQETLWSCRDIQVENVSAKGDYFGMNSENGTFVRLKLAGNYCFDGAKNIRIEDSVLLSKDAFWNTENVEVRNSVITGEYLGWHSKNLKLVNCVISSGQGLCYAENLVLEHCTLTDTTLAFEYASVNALIDGKIISIKNPDSGRIVCDSIQSIEMDPSVIDPDKAEIIQRRNATGKESADEQV